MSMIYDEQDKKEEKEKEEAAKRKKEYVESLHKVLKERVATDKNYVNMLKEQGEMWTEESNRDMGKIRMVLQHRKKKTREYSEYLAKQIEAKNKRKQVDRTLLTPLELELNKPILRRLDVLTTPHNKSSEN